MIVVGEPSGDAHAARLVRELRSIEPATDFEFFGAAGPKLREAGVKAVVESDELSIVGVAEIGRALPMFLHAARDLKAAAARERPDVVILVDFPDFNLKLAKGLKKRGLTIAYYISPQLWAWRKYRISTIRKYVDLLISILPFEKDWYAKRGVAHVEYVGHPLANEVRASRTKAEFCRDNGLDESKPIIALLPGSRRKEIERILPVMLETAYSISAEIAGIQFIVPIVSSKNRVEVDRAIKGSRLHFTMKVVEGETYDALNAADAAAVTSGTATLETGMIGTPMVIVYKGTALNYALLRPLISVEHFGLINLIAEARIATELIQNDLTAARLSSELLRLIEPQENARMREKLRQASDKLGGGGASKRAAELILKLIETRST